MNYHIIVEGERTLTFDANGGKASISQMKVYTQTEVGTLPTAERAGYEFTGWYSEKKVAIRSHQQPFIWQTGLCMRTGKRISMILPLMQTEVQIPLQNSNKKRTQAWRFTDSKTVRLSVYRMVYK